MPRNWTCTTITILILSISFFSCGIVGYVITTWPGGMATAKHSWMFLLKLRPKKEMRLVRELHGKVWNCFDEHSMSYPPALPKQTPPHPPLPSLFILITQTKTSFHLQNLFFFFFFWQKNLEKKFQKEKQL